MVCSRHLLHPFFRASYLLSFSLPLRHIEGMPAPIPSIACLETLYRMIIILCTLTPTAPSELCLTKHLRWDLRQARRLCPLAMADVIIYKTAYIGSLTQVEDLEILLSILIWRVSRPLCQGIRPPLTLTLCQHTCRYRDSCDVWSRLAACASSSSTWCRHLKLGKSENLARLGSRSRVIFWSRA